MIAGQPSRRQFEQTHWSTVMRTGSAAPADAQAALTALCERFWYPVYSYLRCFGHGPQTAQDFTQRFLRHLLTHLCEESGARTQDRFRQYLLMHLREFLAGTPSRESIDASA